MRTLREALGWRCFAGEYPPWSSEVEVAEWMNREGADPTAVRFWVLGKRFKESGTLTEKEEAEFNQLAGAQDSFARWQETQTESDGS